MTYEDYRRHNKAWRTNENGIPAQVRLLAEIADRHVDHGKHVGNDWCDAVNALITQIDNNVGNLNAVLTKVRLYEIAGRDCIRLNRGNV